MAKISGINTNLRGQIGEYLFRKTKYGTIVSEAPTRKETPVRTEGQMYIRTQWVNLGAIYRQFNKTLKKAYEGLGNTMSVYNAFVQANINVVKVFITKQVKANGGSVLAPYQITRGTLPSIAYAKGVGDVLVSNLSLGSLVIDAQTEVGELAEALVANNAEWENGDQLTFFYGRQTVDEVTGTPRAVIVGTKVVQDVTDSTPLWSVTGSLGFASVAGGSGGSGTGGGSETPTVSAPTFSGATQFTETTQVTMSGPAGAEIHYTLDGSIPTAESALYEGPVTLSETTVVKAIAVKDGVSSSVTSRTYTKGSNTGGGDGEN